MALVIALVVAGVTFVSVVRATGASATVPGSAGTPQAGTPVYTEDFSNTSATGGAISILNYAGGAAAAGMTYTADTPYTPAGNQCDGWILNSTTPLPTSDAGCQNNQPAGWGQIQQMAVSLGLAQGQTATQAVSNQALSEYTNNTSGTIAAGTEFKTASSSAIPAIPGHYYAVSGYFAEVNCQAAHAKETFSLIINGTPTVLSSGLDPCGSSTQPNTIVTKLQSAAIQIPAGSTASLGLSLFDATPSGAGNDVAFDLPQIVDVTPQLDKSFSPTSITQGATSTLTFTVTNTSDLAAKSGWTFTDNLPSNVVLAAAPNPTTTCLNAAGTGPSAAITAPAGGTSVTVNGSLGSGTASCTVSVQVTSNVVGVYTNSGCIANDGTAIAGCTSNFPVLTGLNPPGSAVLTVTPVVDLSITKTANLTSYTPGSPITYTVTVRNAGPSTATGARVTDPLPTGLTAATWACAPSAGSTCTATGSGNINDTVTVPSGGSIVYTVTGTVAPGTTGNLVNTANVVPPAGTTDTNCPPAPGAGCSATATTLFSRIGVVKSVSSITDTNADGKTDAGDVVHYQIVATNTGTSTLSNVTVTDVLAAPAGPQLTLSCVPTVPIASLAPNGTVTCTANYTITVADVDNGTITNTATATGTPPNGPDVTATSNATVTTQQSPALSILKSVSPGTVSVAGSTVTYSFVVTNTGNVTLHGITVNETAFSGTGTLSAVSCPTTTLAPAASTTCTATYAVTQADINAGKVTNTATATGTPPTGTPVTSGPSSATVTAAAVDALTVPSTTPPAPSARVAVPTPSRLAYTGVAVQFSLVLGGLLALLGGLITFAGRGRRTRVEDAR